MNVISRYVITNPDFIQIKDILKVYIHDYNKTFLFYRYTYKWKLRFSDRIISVKNDMWHRLSASFHSRELLLSKIKCFERYGYIFSNIPEMKITFISHPVKMTYEHYLNQRNCMFEWKLNAISAKNPELISIFENSFHPLTRKYWHTNEDDDAES